MKNTQLLTISRRIFRVLSVISLIGAILFFLISPAFLLIGYFLTDPVFDSVPIEGLPSFDLIREAMTSFSMHSLVIINSLSLILVYFVFKNFASLMKLLHGSIEELKNAVSITKQTAMLLVGIFFTLVLRAIVSNQYKSSFGQLFKFAEDPTSPIYDKVHAPVVSPLLDDLINLLFPSFTSSTALLFALLLLLFASFLDKKIKLKQELIEHERNAHFTV